MLNFIFRMCIVNMRRYRSASAIMSCRFKLECSQDCYPVVAAISDRLRMLLVGTTIELLLEIFPVMCTKSLRSLHIKLLVLCLHLEQSELDLVQYSNDSEEYHFVAANPERLQTNLGYQSFNGIHVSV